MSQRAARLQWTDWLLLGGPLLIAGVLIFTVVVVLEWRAQPGSPWGQALAEFFFQNPYSAVALIILGLLSVGKATIEYNQ